MAASDCEPSPGEALLNDVLTTMQRYVVFPDTNAAVATVLWTAATHAITAFQAAPRLVVTSPEKRCGKTRLLDIIEGTCKNPLATANATVAAIFRSISEEAPPTLIFDEADTIFGSKMVAEQNEDLRGLLNAGYQRGRPTLRCVGPSQVPTPFQTFAMAAIAGIGKMPDTITDRAVNFTLRRRMPGEQVSTFRSRRDGPVLAVLRERLAQWTADHLDELANAEPEMPVEDRAADTWEPLIAIADAAGGPWPMMGRQACKVLDAAADSDDADASLNITLLTDIVKVFAERDVIFLMTKDLLFSLHALEESPWGEFQMTGRKLAFRLKPFGIAPGFNVAKTARGYSLNQFTDSYRRYIRPNSPNRPEPPITGGVDGTG